jgi:hypothetical protein
MLKELRARYKDEGAFNKALGEYGITLDDVRRQLLWRLTFLRFTDLRFRQGVQITDQEIGDYFEKTVKPAAEQAQAGKPVTLDDYRDKIEEKLAGERVDQELARWLEAARGRTTVEYREDAFR